MVTRSTTAFHVFYGGGPIVLEQRPKRITEHILADGSPVTSIEVRDLTLHLDFEIGDFMFMSIYDPEAQKVLLKGKTFRVLEDFEQSLRFVDAQYPDRIDAESLLEIARVFFQTIDGTLRVAGQIYAEDSDRKDKAHPSGLGNYDFLYVPEVPGSALTEPTLELSLYSDVGSILEVGTFSESSEVVVKYMEIIRAATTIEKTRKDAESVLALLSQYRYKMNGGAFHANS